MLHKHLFFIKWLKNSKIYDAPIFAIFFLSVFLFFGCANVVSPTGGEKDVIAPVLVKAFPENKSTNFTDKKSTLIFSEFIQAKNPDNSIIISPATDNVEFKVKKKRLEILFSDSLLPNTTYSINLNGSVSDITENNIAETFSYIFSTGSTIDSSRLNVTILDAEKQEVQAGTLLALYPDSIPFDSIKNRKASICGYADVDGKVNLFGLKNGNYNLVAFNDADKNRIINTAIEPVAFSSSSITIDSTKKQETVYLFQDDAVALRIKDKKLIGDKALITFTKKYQNLSLQKNDTLNWVSKFSANADSIEIYYAGIVTDTSSLILLSNNVAFDTITLRQTKKKENPTLPLAVNTLTGKKIIPGNYALRIPIGCPITYCIKDSILLKEDSLFLPLTIDTIGSNLVITQNWQEEKVYSIILPDSIIRGYNGMYNAATTISFSVELAENLGNLILKLKTEKPGIVQLLNEKKEVVQEKLHSGNETHLFNYLAPAKYLLRVIDDQNGNKRWDTGNFSTKLQPETIIYYDKEVNVRANWEVEIDWDASALLNSSLK